MEAANSRTTKLQALADARRKKAEVDAAESGGSEQTKRVRRHGSALKERTALDAAGAASAAAATSDATMQGFLLKQTSGSGAMGKRFQSRFFVVHAGFLKYCSLQGEGVNRPFCHFWKIPKWPFLTCA